jgi:hypothetical protein
LLPTAPSFYLLGQLAEGRGDVATALKHYEIAADSDSDVGKSSTERYTHLDLPRNPAKYLQGAAQMDAKGNVFAVVQNPTNVAVAHVQVRLVRYDAATRQPNAQSQLLVITANIGPNQQGQVTVPNVRLKTPTELNLYSVTIEKAELVK